MKYKNQCYNDKPQPDIFFENSFSQTDGKAAAHMSSCLVPDVGQFEMCKGMKSSSSVCVALMGHAGIRAPLAHKAHSVWGCGCEGRLPIVLMAWQQEQGTGSVTRQMDGDKGRMRNIVVMRSSTTCFSGKNIRYHVELVHCGTFTESLLLKNHASFI